MRVLVTVGTTRFDALVQESLSEPVIEVLRARGYTTLVVQCGESDFDRTPFSSQNGTWVQRLDGVGSIEVWNLKPSLQDEYRMADLVISHAGAGTVLDVLRLHKPLIVVPNSSLMDDHQQELAESLADLGHVKAVRISHLAEAIETLDLSTLVPFPTFNGSRFRELLDEEMGYTEPPKVS